ncbi:hypothetical protein [Pantoea sp. BAV 3049]|uniref:hypothetical protein n=1 Tax=Pantoea sp. BAV 3049 TaxID=2654188 RepID=UPI00131C3420|nr:hypothetical protein [Pantoea sp. BAV 3049]
MPITAELLLTDAFSQIEPYVNRHYSDVIKAHIDAQAARIAELDASLCASARLQTIHREACQKAETELAALREQAPVAYSDDEELTFCHNHGDMWETPHGFGRDIPLYRQPIPAAPVAVPDEKTTQRNDWTVGDWVSHFGGRYQNEDPRNYVEFGSMQAVAAMIQQLSKWAETVGWNACRAEVLRLNSESKPLVVMLPERFYSVIQGGKAVMLPVQHGHWLNLTSVKEAIRAAGGEIAE